MMAESLDEAIIVQAAAVDLPEQLLRALVLVESAGNVYAWRVEPAYRYLWDVRYGRPFRPITPRERADEYAPVDFHCYRHSSLDTEWWGQQASWGPLQVMGAVARERGFEAPFPALCSADEGMRVGALVLEHFRARFRHSHGWEGVVAAYNAGAPRKAASGAWMNQGYIDKVQQAGGFAGLID